MPTPISICSAALLMIGADEISSFEEGTREAKLCLNLYQTTLDELLQTYPWRFATLQTQLARHVKTPLFGYGHAYALPPNLLRLLQTQGVEDYRIFEDGLHTNAQNVYITYIARPKEQQMPAYFTRIVEFKMAEILALALQEDLTKSRLLADRADSQLIRARGIDAQQQTTAVMPEANFTLTHVRG